MAVSVQYGYEMLNIPKTVKLGQVYYSVNYGFVGNFVKNIKYILNNIDDY